MRIKTTVGVVLLIAAILGTHTAGYAMMVGNYSEKGFETGSGNDSPGDVGEPSDPAEGAAGESQIMFGYSDSIKDLIIKSATYFLRGKANVDMLSSRLEAVEHEGLLFQEYRWNCTEALENMRLSNYYYHALLDKANNTPYNQDVLARLKAFDYKTLGRQLGVNKDCYNMAAHYLSNGDLRGAYARLAVYSDTVIRHLNAVNQDIQAHKFPEKEQIWKLNQECAQMLLFGQYLAQVCSQL